MNKPPAFQFYAADFLVDGAVKLMSLEARGAYITLLAHAWIEGPLPRSAAKLASYCGIPLADMRRLWPALAPCWKPADKPGFIINPRLEKERRKQAQYRKSQSQRALSRQASHQLAGAEPVPSSPSSSPSPRTTTTAPAAPVRTDSGTSRSAPYAELLPLIRDVLWSPDGKPPAEIKGQAWDERREGSVVKALLKHYSTSQLRVAIEGLGNLRRGYGERPDWLPLGEKCSTLALNRNHSGTQDMMAVATRAYWLVANKRGKTPSDTPSVGGILKRAIEAAS